MKYGNDKKYGLVNGGKQLLTGFPNRASRKATNYFNSKNVDVKNEMKISIHAYFYLFLIQFSEPKDEVVAKYDLAIT